MERRTFGIENYLQQLDGKTADPKIYKKVRYLCPLLKAEMQEHELLILQ